jgi:MFS family permease
VLATIGGFLFGYDTANIGSALPFVPYSLNGFALGYLVAGASLGAAAGALLAGPLADRFRAQVSAGHHRARLRDRSDLVGLHAERGRAAGGTDPDRAGHRSGLRDRYRLHSPSTRRVTGAAR